MGERLLPFTAHAVCRVPRIPGAYFLFRGRDPVCAGVAAGGATLRSELAARLGATEAGGATHFTWIPERDPLQAYRLQIAAHARWDLRPPEGSALVQSAASAARSALRSASGS